jgi:alanine dehydrogenase
VDVGVGSEVLVLGEAEVASALEPAALIDALGAAFAALARDEVTAPTRSAAPAAGGGSLLSMPGFRTGGALVVKHVGLFPGNVSRGLPAHPAVVCVFDAATGTLAALLGATALTALRTAGAAALAVRLAARADARVAAVVGSGPVAQAHLDVLPAARPFAEIRVAARDPHRARDVAAGRDVVVAPSIEAAVRDADVVCLCTSAATPIVDPAWLAPGAHVGSVGFAPPGGELDPALARTGRLLVETRDAFAPPPAGCAELAGLDPASAAELGDLVLGRRPARVDDAELTVFKAMGHVVEDLAAAELAVARARAAGAGRTVRL